MSNHYLSLSSWFAIERIKSMTNNLAIV